MRNEQLLLRNKQTGEFWGKEQAGTEMSAPPDSYKLRVQNLKHRNLQVGWRLRSRSGSPSNERMWIGIGRILNGPSVCCRASIQRSLRSRVSGKITHSTTALVGIRCTTCGAIGQGAKSHSCCSGEWRRRRGLRGGRNRVVVIPVRLLMIGNVIWGPAKIFHVHRDFSTSI